MNIPFKHNKSTIQVVPKESFNYQSLYDKYSDDELKEIEYTWSLRMDKLEYLYKSLFVKVNNGNRSISVSIYPNVDRIYKLFIIMYNRVLVMRLTLAKIDWYNK